MIEQLTSNDCRFIIESLDYTIRKFQDYQHYPSYEFKLKQVKEAEDIRQKMRGLRDALKQSEK